LLGQLARRRFVEIVDERGGIDGRLRVVGREECRCGCPSRDSVIVRPRFDEEMDHATERLLGTRSTRFCCDVESVFVTEPAFSL
jgi:hypothetical protein